MEQEGLIDEIVRPLLPGLADEPPVLRQLFDAGRRWIIVGRGQGALPSIVGDADSFSGGFVDELKAFAGRERKVRAQSR
jgi:hypothetical protein